MNRGRLQKQLIHHEGVELQPYFDSEGVRTIGVGRNMETNPIEDEIGRRLDNRGITRDEAMLLLNNDVDKVVRQVKNNIPAYFNVSESRQHVLLDMAFNLGISGFLKFRNMLSALERRDFKRASEEMLDSRWARQVGRRAQTLSLMMRSSMSFDQAMQQSGSTAANPRRDAGNSNRTEKNNDRNDRDSFDRDRFRDRDER